MEINSDHFEIIAKIEEVHSGEEISYLNLEVKTEPHDEKNNINTNIFEERNNFEPLQIIGEKRKNKEIFIDLSNLEDKKLKKNL